MGGRAGIVRHMTLAAFVGAAVGALYVRFGLRTEIGPRLELSRGMRLSVALWVLFSLYWTIAAKESAPAQTSESAWSRRLHLFIVNVALLVLIFPVPGLTRRLLPASRVLVVAGLLVQAAFALLAVWARRHLGANWSGEVRIATGHALVRSGPYGVVRHPIYTALIGMYLGTILVSGELHALVALAIVAPAYWRKIRLEERALRETFRAEHEAYRRETWAWIPGLY